jgi:hypothetical protein
MSTGILQSDLANLPAIRPTEPTAQPSERPS